MKVHRLHGVFLGCVITAMSLVPTAVADPEGKPFGIARFTIQTTRLVASATGAFGPGFVNEPYVSTQAGGHPERPPTTALEFAERNGRRRN